MNTRTNSTADSEKKNLIDVRPIAVFGDGVTTEDISPAGAISEASPSGQYLLENGVEKNSLYSFDSHRQNDHVMTRGTFGNPHLKNLMIPGIEGGYTQYFGDAPVPVPIPLQKIIAAQHAKPTFIYDAAIAYQQSGRQLIIIAGENYGSGPSCDWAAKGTALLGIRAVITKSIDDTHRSQLIKMGILPLTFKNQTDYYQIAPMHSCTFSIADLTSELKPMQEATLTTSCGFECPVIIRLGSSSEISAYLSGGIPPYFLNQFLEATNTK